MVIQGLIINIFILKFSLFIMKQTNIFILCLGLLFLLGCQERTPPSGEPKQIAAGQMPNIVTDITGKLHMTFGKGDSILYTYSTDGYEFAKPILVATLPNLSASHTRGPQIAITEFGISITACTNKGDIFSYYNEHSITWTAGNRVNDTDTTAKENLMALSGEAKNLFAVWLDLRDGHNKLFGSASQDGGKTWEKNVLVYASPDTTVCECCKPTVLVANGTVNVMFRNCLNGNRDLYLINSIDGGEHFANLQKLGITSWKLDGCPMDGGSLVINRDQKLQTVWRRKGKIYECEPGKPEIEIGEGRGCTLTTVNNQNVYAWVEKGEVICVLPGKVKKNLGKGHSVAIQAINDKQVLCVWEKEGNLYSAAIDL
jgi:hypothetical protein